MSGLWKPRRVFFGRITVASPSQLAKTASHYRHLPLLWKFSKLRENEDGRQLSGPDGEQQTLESTFSKATSFPSDNVCRRHSLQRSSAARKNRLLMSKFAPAVEILNCSQGIGKINSAASLLLAAGDFPAHVL